MSEIHKIIFKVQQGPVRILSLDGRGTCNEFEYGNEIVIREEFPGVEGSAFYFLTLERPVTDADEISSSDEKLRGALQRLTEVWEFAGGSLLGNPQRQRLLSATLPPFETNTEEVERNILAAEGLKKVSRTATVPIAWSATYNRMPLETAIKLCRRADKDQHLRRLFQYYHWARIWEERWFVDLYKVRDVLKRKFGNVNKVRDDLGISYWQWRKFGKTLNNYDLRHAISTPDGNESISKAEIDACRKTARQWIELYLERV